MAGTVEAVLERYGRAVSLHYGAEPVGVSVRAFLQPVLDRRGDQWQQVPTPLGEARRDRFLYLGPPGVSLEGLEDGYLQCGAVRYEVMQAQPIYVGECISHWWGLLRPRDAEE